MWQEATVERILDQTPTVKSFFVRPANPFTFVAGQHVDVRLTAPDGYQAERSYSIGSAPNGDTIELVIERLDVGEVSPFFHEVVQVGDTIEMRGPIGGHFNWLPQDGGPILLVGGGSGVVPLVSMLRERQLFKVDTPFVLVYSARTFADVIFRDELMRLAETDDGVTLILTLTREPGADSRRALGPHRPGDHRRGAVPPRRAAPPRLHLRRDRLRRGRLDVSGRGRRAGEPCPHRTLWRHAGREARCHRRGRPGTVTRSDPRRGSVPSGSDRRSGQPDRPRRSAERPPARSRTSISTWSCRTSGGRATNLASRPRPTTPCTALNRVRAKSRSDFLVHVRPQLR